MCQADSGVEEVTVPEVCVEEVWGSAEGLASIAELALQQRAVHYPLVQHHCLLASLLHAAMSFSLRLKPLSLFDTKVCIYLFDSRHFSNVRPTASGFLFN